MNVPPKQTGMNPSIAVWNVLPLASGIDGAFAIAEPSEKGDWIPTMAEFVTEQLFWGKGKSRGSTLLSWCIQLDLAS